MTNPKKKSNSKTNASAKTRTVSGTTGPRKKKWTLDIAPFSVGPVKSEGLKINSAAGRNAKGRSAIGPQRAKIVITRREVILSVTSATTFEMTVISLQPGLTDVLAWAATIAQGYQNYRVTRLRLAFDPKVSSFNDEGSMGTLALAYGSNPTAQLPDSMDALLNIGSCRNKIPSKAFDLDVDTLDRSPGLIRRGIIPGGADVNAYDRGLIYVAVEGSASGAQQLGKVWADYELELWNPQTSTVDVPGLNYKCYTATEAATSQVTTVDRTCQWTVGSNGLGITQATGVLTMHAGLYMLSGDVQFVASGANITACALQIFKNGVLVKAANEFVPASTQKNVSVFWPLDLDEGDTITVKTSAVFTGTCTAASSLFIQSC